MNERFWAPTRPTITPDAVAVALLTPHGGDRAGDLGASLLGMHRAGAAACEFVAKGAVPSEHRLLEVLATCRESMGGPAADAVAKSVEVRYAGLLVRDLLDAAETTAAGLFRACVSKGIAPPLAASRVGAVYGVPTSELGKYRALACDPRTNPLALTDAADRALLGYVAKVVATEVGDVKEEVSKATQRRGHSHVREVDETDEGWDAREHPRSTTTGQFVRGGPTTGPPVKEEQPERHVPTPMERLRGRLGLGEESAPEVVVAPEPVVEAPVVERKTRKVRQTRKPRGTRQTQLVPTGNTTAQKPKMTTAGMTTAGMSAKLETVRDIRAKLGMNMTLEQQKVNAGDLHIPAEQVKNRPADLMELPIPGGTGSEYGEVYENVVWSMGQGEGLEFRIHNTGTGMHDDPHRFRAGWLVEGAGQPEDNTERLDGKKTEAENRLDFLAAIMKARVTDVGAEVPTVVKVTDMANVENQIARLASKAAWVDASDADAVKEEAENIELMADIHNGQEVLVHWQPAIDDDGDIRYSHRRPQPIIEQFEIVGESFRGRLVEGGKLGSIQDQWLIDPNQALTRSEDYQAFWDSKRGVVIHKYILRPISDAEANELQQRNTGMDEFFGKAVQDRGRLRGREAVEFEQEHPRDTSGRFADKHEAASGVAPTAIPTPIERLRAKLGLEEVDVQDVTESAPTVRRTRQTRKTRKARGTRTSQPLPRVEDTMAPMFSPAGLSTSSLTTASPLTSGLNVDRQLRTEAMVRSVNQVFTERAEALPDLPRLSDASDFYVLGKSDWSELTDALADEDLEILDAKGYMIPFRGLFKSRVLGGTKHKYDSAQAEIVNNGTTDLFSNEYEIVGKPLGQPFFVKYADANKLGHHIADAFDEHPDIDQVTVYEDPNSRYIQLYGNTRPVAKQYIIEVDEGVNLGDDDLQILNVGEYRTKNVTIESNGEMKPLLPVDADIAGTGALSLPVQIFRVIAPRVGYRRVVGE